LNLTTAPVLATATAATANAGTYSGTLTASGAVDANYTIGYATGNLVIGQAPLTVAANPESKVFGASDPMLTYRVTGLVNNPALGIADTAGTVLSGSLTRASGESALGGPYSINQGSLAANSNYILSFTPSDLIITGVVAEAILGTAQPIISFNAGQVIFAGVIDNETYYHPGSFWHISLNPDNADPGFDVMRGTNNFNSRMSKHLHSCDSVSGGGFCETWSFPQQFEKAQEK